MNLHKTSKKHICVHREKASSYDPQLRFVKELSLPNRKQQFAPTLLVWKSVHAVSQIGLLGLFAGSCECLSNTGSE